MSSIIAQYMRAMTSPTLVCERTARSCVLTKINCKFLTKNIVFAELKLFLLDHIALPGGIIFQPFHYKTLTLHLIAVFPRFAGKQQSDGERLLGGPKGSTIFNIFEIRTKTLTK